MNILVLGGTGVMGRPLARKLALSNNVFVTTRQKLQPCDGIEYLQGNAKNLSFLRDTLLNRHWNAIIDFMVWGTEFSEAIPFLLANTDQYLFISSARVYAQSDVPITEKTPRLLDVSVDKEYLATNEYALAKAREEDLLFNSGKSNFTIIRPTITYNTYRLQLGVLEKEGWLYRALHGRSIVFSDDIANKVTTMTFGDDVATGITALIGKRDSLGEIFNITSTKSLLWNEVLEIYLDVIEREKGFRPRVVYTKKSTNLRFKDRVYQVIYCRYFNRSFDNSKIAAYCDVDSFVTPQKGLADCLREFLANPSFQDIDWRLEAINDRVAGERTGLSEIPKIRGKIYYLLYRYNMELFMPIIRIAEKTAKSLRTVIK